MKHAWWAVVGAVLVGVFWVTVPPRTVDELGLRWRGEPRRHDPALAQRARLTVAARTANVRLQATRWADSLGPLVLEHGTTGAWLGLTGPDRPAAEEAELRRLLAAEIDPDEVGRAAVGVAFLPAGAGGWPGAPVSPMEGYFLDRAEDGRAWCLVARSPGGPPGRSEPAVPRRLDAGLESLTGLCRWVHRYGMPGRHVRSWMEGPGTVLGSALGPFDGDLWRSDAMPPDARFERRGLLGLPGGLASVPRFGVSFYWLGGVQRDRCLSGRPAACTRVLLEHPPGPRTRAAAWTGFDAVEGFRTWPQDPHLLATLEEEFGTERFQAFWASGAPVPEAFQAAFGRPLGEWVMAWYGRYAGLTPPGPSPRAAGLLGTLAVLLAAGLAAAFAVQRWRVTE